MNALNELLNTCVRIPSGSFMLGIGGEELGLRITPVHVDLTTPFSITKFVITQDIFHAVMGIAPWNNPVKDPYSHMTDEQHERLVVNKIKVGPKFPAVMIDQAMAEEFCRLASQSTGRKLRLPTEAEWEWACQGGKPGLCYWGGVGYTIFRPPKNMLGFLPCTNLSK